MNDKEKTKIAIIGLGYVGLPLAVEFGKIFETIGFDLNESRIRELLNGDDSTLEVSSDQLRSSKNLYFYPLNHLHQLLSVLLFLYSQQYNN